MLPLLTIILREFIKRQTKSSLLANTIALAIVYIPFFIFAWTKAKDSWSKQNVATFVGGCIFILFLYFLYIDRKKIK